MVTILSESFETDGNGTRYTTTPGEFTDSVGDFFLRTDGSTVGSFYQVSGADGSFYFAAMDTNGDGGPTTVMIDFEDIDIAGFTNLTFSGLFAEDDDGSNQDWDADSSVEVQVSIDGGAFETILDIEAEGGTNTVPRVDTDGDGLGDGTELTDSFTALTAGIAGTGSLLDLRILIENLEAGDEDIALDLIALEGDPEAPAKIAGALDSSSGGASLNQLSFVASPDNTSTNGAFPNSSFDVFGVTDRTVNFDFADDSAGSFPPDSFGLVSTADTAPFFGVEDLDNGDNPGGTGTATWTFDISGAASLADVMIDFAAMGDFEAGDNAHTFTASIDGGAPITLFEIDADNDDSFTYTLESGTEVTLNDPLKVGGVAGPVIPNNFTTFTSSALAGLSGAELAITLTSAANNGGEEVFAFRDIMVTAQGGGTPTPRLAIDDVTIAEGNSGTATATFTVTLTNAASGPFTVDFATSDATATAGSDYAAAAGTLNFAGTDGETQTIDVTINSDMVAEQDETFLVTLSNIAGGPAVTLTDGEGTGTITNDDGAPLTPIHQIQGNAGTQITAFGRDDASPLLGSEVTIRGVVVGDFQDGTAGTDGDLNGFYLQEEDTDADADPLTSEGVFVFDGSSPVIDVAKGDLVEVTGTVDEFFGETQIDTITSVTVISSGNGALATAAPVTFPVASTTTNSDGELIGDLEAFEGMLVTIPEELTVSDLFTLGRFGDIGLHADGRLEVFTQSNAPSVSGFASYQDLAVRNTVVLDDGSTVQNPDIVPFDVAAAPGTIGGQLDAQDELRSGDTVADLTGVVRYSRGSGGSGDEIYRINPVEEVVFENDNPREPGAPDVGGDLTVAAFNVLNFFTSLDDGISFNNLPPAAGPTGQEPRGADDLTQPGATFAPSTQADDSLGEFNRQLDKLVAAISEIGADIFGLIEIENEFPGFVDGNNLNGQTAVERLIAELNTALPGANYQFAAPSNGQTFGDSSDAISVGLVYDATAVQLAAGTTVEVLTDADLAGLGADPGVPVFDGPSTSRAPIAATFEEIASGETFTVAVNHFKSKGSPGTSPFGDTDIGDGVGSANQTRLNAAVALDAWLDTDPTGSGDEDVLIIGDLNAYAQEDPIQFLLDEGYVDQATRFLEPDSFEYSFGFPLSLSTSPQVQAFGALDYGLATSSLSDQITGAAEWHINADEASIFDYNLEFRPQAQADGLFAPTPFRASDHDPLIIGLDLGGDDEPVIISGGPGRDRLRGTDADEIFQGGGGFDFITTGGGSDEVDLAESFGNGRRDITVVTDFDTDTDIIGGIASSDVFREIDLFGRTILILSDNDLVLLFGVGDPSEIVYENDTLL